MSRKYKTLTIREERDLFAAHAAGDRTARARIIASLMPYTIAFVRRRVRREDMVDDAIACGVLGVVEAFARFDPSRGARFMTYARYWVIAMLNEFVRTNQHPVRFGLTEREEKAYVYFCRQAMRGERPTAEDVHAATGLQMDRAEPLVQMLSAPAAPVAHVVHEPGGDAVDLADAAQSPEELAARLECSAAVAEMVSSLRPRQREVLERRAMRDEADRDYLETIGDEWGVSRERVRQVEEATIKVVRVACRKARICAHEVE